MIAPKILYHDDQRRIWSAGGGFNSHRGYAGFHHGYDEIDHGQFEVPRQVDHAPACCLLIRKEVFEKIGFMDSRYFTYVEDTDFSYRAKRAGLTLMYLPSARLLHKAHSLTGGLFSDFMMRYTTRNRIYFMLKHFGPWRGLYYVPAYQAHLRSATFPKKRSVPPCFGFAKKHSWRVLEYGGARSQTDPISDLPSAFNHMPVTRNLRGVVIKNASANLIRLAGSGIVALLLPPFLVRMLPADTYSAWALLLQLTLYVGLLDFGIQTAVARFVAHADELGAAGRRDAIVSTATALLVLAAIAAFIGLGILAWQLPRIFTAMPAPLYSGARTALLLMGGTFALGLPFSVIHAVFVGFQRNEISTAIVIGSRFAMAALILVVVFHHGGLAAMGAAVAIANLGSYSAAFFSWRIWASHVKLRISSVSGGSAHKIAGYSMALAVWSVGMLMISGLDLSIVAKFDFHATAYYAVAATLTGFVTQAQGAIFAALLPAAAVLSARGNAQKLGAILISATRYGMLILLATALPMVAGARLILRIWVGGGYAAHGAAILQVLVAANVVRLAALPYATLLLGTNQQRKVIFSPLAEGVVNLFASILLAYFMGAIGVAIGTLIGSFVGIGFHIFRNMPRTSGIAFSRSELRKTRTTAAVGVCSSVSCARVVPRQQPSVALEGDCSAHHPDNQRCLFSGLDMRPARLRTPPSAAVAADLCGRVCLVPGKPLDPRTYSDNGAI